MFETLLLLLAALLSFIGMAWMSAAMRAHWRQLYPSGNSEPNSRMLRILSIFALFGSGVCCLFADNASMAVLVWVMYLTAAAFTVAMLLSTKPDYLRVVCPRFFRFS